MYKISIIIPVYNASEYLEECLKSLQDQTIGFENLEVIMVDDGSTDGSQDLMKQYERRNSNVKCIYLNENSGAAGRPRNEALHIAAAEYVMFLDSDDMYYNDACEVLFAAMQKIETDCISGYYSTFDEDIVIEDNALRGKGIEKKIYYVPDDIEIISNFQSHFACKIYKRKTIEINAIDFPNGIIGEDTVFFWRYLCNIRSIYYMPVPIIKYRQRKKENKSVSYKLTQKYFDDILQGLELIEHYFSEKGYRNERKYALKNTNAYFISQLINSNLPRDSIYVFLDRWGKIKGEWIDTSDGDLYLRIIMDDVIVENTDGASNKILMLRELKNYYNEIWDAKIYYEKQATECLKTTDWLEKQAQYKDNRIKELENAIGKLNEGKDWLEKQYENMKTQYDRLKQWCDEIQHGKDWLEKEWKAKCMECEELKILLLNK